MYLNFNLTLKFSLFITLIISSPIHTPICLCQTNNSDQYSACGQLFNCAKIQSIGYPFWGENRPQYCGHPSFYLSNCQSDSPLLTIADRSYRVLSIDNATRTLTVARDDLSNNICPKFLYNTTIDSSSLFRYVNGNHDLTLHYRCTASISSSINQNLPNFFNCTVNETTSISYYTIGSTSTTTSTSVSTSTSSSSFNSSSTNTSTTTSTSTIINLDCENSVVVPVNQSWAEVLGKAEASISDVQESVAGGFGVEWAANDTNCNRCEISGGRCGYNSSLSSFACYCVDRPYSLTCNNTQIAIGGGSTKTLRFGPKLIIGLLVSTAVVIILSAVIICCIRRRRCLLLKSVIFRKKETLEDQKIEEILRNIGDLAPKRYNYQDILKMTNSFAKILGKGGFGSVYKGKLPDGYPVAVKVLSETKGDGEDFTNEVVTISRTSHVNVVNLVGFCYASNKRALIYDFMPNGSLDKFIYNEGSSSTNSRLPWKTLYDIVVGTARGLEYLHGGCNTKIVHFDIKPNNILLDVDLRPKISDFGLAKLCKRKESVVSMSFARGTDGYIAPEVCCHIYGQVSHKSDVYSYGMTVLEIAGARPNDIEFEVFTDRIYEHLEHGVGLRGFDGSEEEKEIVRKMILVSLWCIQTSPSDRPSMSKVVEMLEGSLEMLEIPPKPYILIPSQRSSSPLSQSTKKLLD